MSTAKNKGKKRRRQEKMRGDRIHQDIAPMPPNFKKELLPYAVVKLLTGAKAIEKYHMKAHLVGLRWNDNDEVLHIEDFQIIRAVAESLKKEQIIEKNLASTLFTLPVGMDLHRKAAKKVAAIVDAKVGKKKKVIFIKDRSGCGYWRMVVPARYMDPENVFIDMAEIEVIYDYLLEYDVIVVQRLHSWSEFYTVERLKRHGKRIIYDIDDNIFDIPADNPAALVIKADQYEAARGIMNLCDAVTTTTETLKEQLKCPEKTIVIPNAIDLSDGYPEGYRASPDEWKRIVWMGSATHNQDWMLCAGAVDRVLKEQDNVRLVVLGYLPPIVRQYVNDPEKPWWDKRVEYMEFQEVETYITTTKQIHAECALAPLEDTAFNSSKSNLKWVEYTAAGIPTIASDVSPYKEHMVSGISGILASSEEDWYQAMMAFLGDDEYCGKTVAAARQVVEDNFDIKQVSLDWEKAIFGE